VTDDGVDSKVEEPKLEDLIYEFEAGSGGKCVQNAPLGSKQLYYYGEPSFFSSGPHHDISNIVTDNRTTSGG